MAVTKMVQQLSGGKGGNAASVLRSPMAVCMLIRMAAKVLDEDPKFVPHPFPPPPFSLLLALSFMNSGTSN